MQSFDDVLFTMTSFSAKKLEKTILRGEENNGLKSSLLCSLLVSNQWSKRNLLLFPKPG